MDFVNRLGYLGGVVPSIGADKKCIKHLIDVSWLIGDLSREDRRTTFGEFESSSIFWLLVSPLF